MGYIVIVAVPLLFGLIVEGLFRLHKARHAKFLQTGESAQNDALLQIAGQLQSINKKLEDDQISRNKISREGVDGTTSLGDQEPSELWQSPSDKSKTA